MKKPNHKKKKKATRKKGPSTGTPVRVDNISTPEPGGQEESKKSVSLTVRKLKGKRRRRNPFLDISVSPDNF